MTKEGPLSYKEKTEIPSRQDHEFYRAEAGHASSIRTDFFFKLALDYYYSILDHPLCN